MQKMSDHDLAQVIWDYMWIDEPLEKADVIIGLGSADTRTADWCAEIFLQGYAPKILFSGARGKLTKGLYEESEADVYERRAIELGVPSQVIIKESRAENTGQNIAFSYNALMEIGITAHAIILVAKPYMLRRTYATFMKQWPADEKPHIMMTAIDLTMDQYTTESYIGLKKMTQIMVGDLQRIIEYPKLGFQIEQQIPSEVQAAYQELVTRGYTKHLL